MPKNLNALIRYKQIDTCLRNRFRKWTVDDLRDACTEALGEHRGRYQRIAESTVRDDIRVMRGDILGFNAPIEVEGGYYFYADPDYSIFNSTIDNLDLLKKIFDLLLKAREQLEGSALTEVLLEIAGITGQSVPADIEVRTMKKKVREAMEFYLSEEPARYVESRSAPGPGKEPGLREQDEISFILPEKPAGLYSWHLVLGLL